MNSVHHRRHSLPVLSRGEQEHQWRLVAGLMLLAAIFSLVATLDQTTGERKQATTASAFASAMDNGRSAMEPERGTNTVARPSVGVFRSPDRQETNGIFGGIQHEMEAWIQRFPWPTLMLGLLVGYLLARRVRY